MATGTGLFIKVDSFLHSVLTEEELLELKDKYPKKFEEYWDVCRKQEELFEKVSSS